MVEERHASTSSLNYFLFMEKIIIQTQQERQVVDVTEKINETIAFTKVNQGLCHLFLPHSTAALTTVYLDEKKELDLLGAFEIMVARPSMTQGGAQDHTHVTSHLPNHVLASLLGSSLAIPIENGKLVLGDFQRVVLVELQGPEARTIMVACS